MFIDYNTPFPPSGGYVQAVRQSASALRIASGVAISKERIYAFLHSPVFSSSFDRLSRSHGLALPLKFSSVLSELNVISILSLLNMGSGYRIPLHACTGRGAWDSIRALVLSLFITSTVGEGDLLSAKAMKSMTSDKVAQLMQLPIHSEKPHDSLPGVIIGERGGPLFDLIQLVTGILNETGAVLLSQGYPSLGSFVLQALREGEKAGKARGGGVDIDVVLERLVLAIPAFRDMGIVDGKPVYVFKKALFLLHAIFLRFSSHSSGNASSSTIPVPETSSLPVFSDNVIPSMLVYLGIIDISHSTSPSLAKAFQSARNVDTLLQSPPEILPASENVQPQQSILPKEGPILSQDDAYILRASAIDACQKIIDEAHGETEKEWEWLRKLTLPDLDIWLWSIAKDRADYRKLERFVLRDTVFF